MNKDTEPLVSISCITYNHANYIRDTIEGFLMQKSVFKFEVLIHDDASSDGTEEIIREYEAKYPEIIKPLYEKENQWVNGRRGSAVFNFPRARGKYIALCEGDDYWTDPLKLQKQVDFLEGNPDCSLCFHAAKHMQADDPDNFYIHRPKKIPSDNKFEIKHAIIGGGEFITTNSMVFQHEHILEHPKWMDLAPVGDLPLMLLLASKGKMGYLNDVMSVYRKCTINSWSFSMNNNKEVRKHHHIATLRMWNEFAMWNNYKHYWLILIKILQKLYIYFKAKTRKIIEKSINNI